MSTTPDTQEAPRALYRFNGGKGTILCSGCQVMLYPSLTVDQMTWLQAGMPPQYCQECHPRQRPASESSLRQRA